MRTLVLFIILLTSCRAFDSFVGVNLNDESKCVEHPFTESGDALRRFGELRELCDHVEWRELVICTDTAIMPHLGTETCLTIQEEAMRLNGWLDYHQPPLLEACSNNPNCAAILDTWD